MPSTFFGLNIARSGMSTYNAVLNTTAHNIANVKTTGYSRQVVKQQATEAISFKTTYGMVGTGVDAISIDSQRDIYYDNKYRMSNTSYSRYESLNYYMNSIENDLYAKDSTSGGMTNSLDNFFKVVTSLTTDPSSTTIRTQTVGYADTLVKSINEVANSLQALQKDLNDQIASTVDQINAYAQQIASLNKQIATIEIYGTKANDLRDQRATIIDELSALVDVDVVEKEPTNGNGLAQYIVSIAGSPLVDTNDYNTIKYTAMDTCYSMNDMDKMYDLTWSTGQSFDKRSKALGGKLQALFEMRDGNNNETFEGKATGTAGSKTLTVTDVNDLGNSLLKLDIPASDGVITLGNATYNYKSFTATVDADGNYTYTFTLENALGRDIRDEDMHISDAVDYRGVPYYMSQLNEFIRTFSYNFNKVQTSGYDLNDNAGQQMFIAKDKVNGIEMRFSDTVKTGFKFDSLLALDANGKIATDTEGYANTSYYMMTALNCNIDSQIAKDGSLLALSDTQGGGVSNGGNLAKMSDLANDTTMFRQGKPGSFLQVLTSAAGVDGSKVKTAMENAENIKNAVANRRLSTAGVDEDEEGQNMIICQNLLNYQYKVLSVMNEVLDKLINGTAV